MLLTLLFDPGAARQWHLSLLEALSRRAGITVVVEPVEGKRVDANLRRLFRLEAAMHGLQVPGLSASIGPDRLAAFRATRAIAADLAIDLSGQASGSGRRVWRLTFDGEPGESALLASILRGRAPVAELREGSDLVAAARLGTDANGVVLATFEDMLARSITLVCGALDGAAPRLPEGAGPDVGQTGPLSTREIGLFAAKSLARHVVRSAHRLLYQSPHWRVGWRKLDGEDLFGLRRHPDTGWHDLRDDGARFYADPFPLLHDGTLTLFVEEFPHQTGKGIISAVPFGPGGPLGRPEPVLDLPYHLSYPFVFERDGAVWMIPESCAAQTVDLFRSTRFPGGWVKEATLLSGVTASDATLCQWQGRWWMFATVKDGGAFSDALHLWSAADFRGPWVAHERNPVLIDIASARPAGRMIERGGSLLRPVQDCRAGYGAALGLARVRQLGDAGFAQDVETILTAGPRWPGRRLHTLNLAGGYEFIDGSGWARRPWSRRSAAVPA